MDAIGVIGIDAATQIRKTGLAMGEIRGAKGQLLRAYRPKNLVEEIAQFIDEGPERILLAVDAPLGWPKALGESLVLHEAGLGLGVPLKESHCLFRRHTDTVVKKNTGKLPLDVGANFIARTAHSILTQLQEIPRFTKKRIALKMAWETELDPGVFMIEVYPGATLKAHQISSPGYKKGANEGEKARAQIIEDLRQRMDLPPDTALMLENDDVLDAALCVLSGFDFLQNKTIGPTAEELPLATKEGWIWCRPLP